MNNKPTVTIGIPAYNEAQNIKRLLTSVLSQELRTVSVEQIIVVSDCSTDETVAEVHSVDDPRIICFPNPARLGTALSQNRILDANTSDILILLNADVAIPDNFIEQISQPILQQQADLVGARIQPLPHRNFFEKIINFSVNQKNKLYESLHSGNNLYTSCGRGRAFSKNLAKNLRWPKLTSEDSFSYLFCVQNGFKYAYAREATVYFRSPANFKDHLKQSARFLNSQKEMTRFFLKTLVNKEYSIPKRDLLINLIQSLTKNPLNTLLYLIVLVLVKLTPNNSQYLNPTWTASGSSKQVL